jgi:hypothetical protein
MRRCLFFSATGIDSNLNGRDGDVTAKTVGGEQSDWQSPPCLPRCQTARFKPEKFYGIIENLYDHGRMLELFARDRREGWDFDGNEVRSEPLPEPTHPEPTKPKTKQSKNDKKSEAAVDYLRVGLGSLSAISAS